MIALVERLRLNAAVIRDYRRERLPLPLVATVSLLLTLAGRTGGATSGASFPADAFLAMLLFTQFRILDDLADRRRDEYAHPRRVLVRAASVRPVGVTALALTAATMAMLLVGDASPAAVAGWLLLIVTLCGWYILRQGRTLLGDHLLLAKYPAFVWIIANAHVDPTRPWPAASLPVALAMLGTYLAACVYEALHDTASPAAARPALVVSEGMLLALTLGALSMQGHL